MKRKEKISLALKKLIELNIPVIYIQDFDYIRVNEVLCEVISKSEIVGEWTPGTGTTNFVSWRADDDIDKKEELKGFLLRQFGTKKLALKFVILREIQDYIDKPEVKSLIAKIAQRKLYDRDFELTLIIISSVLNVPEEIDPYVSYLEMELPDDEEIDRLIEEHIETNQYKKKGDFDSKDLPELRLTLKGMSPYQIDRVLDIAMSKNGSLDSEDTALILAQKKQMVRKSGVLEFIETEKDKEDIGGLNFLKKYLNEKGIIRGSLAEAMRLGISTPKGIMMVGMPGCGKSLCAQVAARSTGKREPLLKMDMGSLMGKYVGQSEENMRKAIRTAEAVAPCVLWIDEIEKAFSGIGGDNDVMTRMFGYFLSWMQDKESAVYVIATANNIDKLPAELKRKGRFDEIFFVGLPYKEERKEIFRVHLKKKNQDVELLEGKEWDAIANNTIGFNGADIEHVVNRAIEKRFLSKKTESKDGLIDKIELTINDIKSAVMETSDFCIAKTCKKDLREMLDKLDGYSIINAKDGTVIKAKSIKEDFKLNS